LRDEWLRELWLLEPRHAGEIGQHGAVASVLRSSIAAQFLGDG
jgi:hypothetical protein